MEQVLLVARLAFVALVLLAVVVGFAPSDGETAPVERAAAAPPRVHVDRPYRPCGYFQEYGGRHGWSCSMGDHF